MARKQKILMVAHGHPDFNPGGGEIAAYQLHKALNGGCSGTPVSTLTDSAGDSVNGTEEVEFDSVFFARHGQEDLVHGGTPFAGTGRPGEVIFYSSMPDWFRFSQPDKARVWRDFRGFLELHQPDIVHFHHYFQLGLELLREVKNVNPDIRVVLTLHEYMAICNNEGQMLKVNSGELCYESSPAACATCFKKRTSQDFFLRRQFIQSCFECVDRFVAPSNFLKQRYMDWGLEEKSIVVIENLLESEYADDSTLESDPVPVGALSSSGMQQFRTISSSLEVASDNLESDAKSVSSKKQSSHYQRPLRLAYYGQINRFKGLEILLDAMSRLPKRIRNQVHLSVNGSGLERQVEAFQDNIRTALKSLGETVSMRGRYQSCELPNLLSATDWMIVPSVWWENSPVVILEAKKYGVPVICSDIGGMREKIEHGYNGRHFLARRSESLAEQITWAVENRHLRDDYARNMAESYPGSKPLREHRNLYLELTKAVSNDKGEVAVLNERIEQDVQPGSLRATG